MFHVQMPNSEAAWRAVAEGFLQKCQFPHCVGVLDAKRIVLQASGHSSSFHNKECSVLLTAAVGADYKFLHVSVRAQAEDSDTFVFEDSDFRRLLDQGLFSRPAAEPLHNSNTLCPYVFVGSDVYPLRSDLITPFSCEDLDAGQRLFNQHLSRVHSVAENAFGILTSQWRIFHTSIYLHPEKVATITLATVCLHNFLCGQRSEAYLPAGLVDSQDGTLRLVEGSWRRQGLGVMRAVQRKQEAGSCSHLGEEVRNAMRDYVQPPTGSVT